MGKGWTRDKYYELCIMGKIQSFTDLNAWKEGHKLVLSVYKTTASLPKDEKFGLIDQIRRAAVSITSNIAEGFSRYGGKEKQQFYRVALGSLTELQNQLLVIRDVGYMPQEQFNELAEQSVVASKLINGLIKSSRNT